jgi:hypothetical protein
MKNGKKEETKTKIKTKKANKQTNKQTKTIHIGKLLQTTRQNESEQDTATERKRGKQKLGELHYI